MWNYYYILSGATSLIFFLGATSIYRHERRLAKGEVNKDLIYAYYPLIVRDREAWVTEISPKNPVKTNFWSNFLFPTLVSAAIFYWIFASIP